MDTNSTPKKNTVVDNNVSKNLQSDNLKLPIVADSPTGMDTGSNMSADSKTSKGEVSDSEFEPSLSNYDDNNVKPASPIIVSDTEEVAQEPRYESNLGNQKEIYALKQQVSFWKNQYGNLKNFYNEMHVLNQQQIEHHTRLTMDLETNFRCQIDNITMHYNRLHQEFIGHGGNSNSPGTSGVSGVKSKLQQTGTKSPRIKPHIRYTKFYRKPEIIEFNLRASLKAHLTSKDWLLTQQQNSETNISIEPLETWFLAHLKRPFPTTAEKYQLAKKSNLDMTQVQIWFCHARMRAVRELDRIGKRCPWAPLEQGALESFVYEPTEDA